jgi:hypothetical protein
MIAADTVSEATIGIVMALASVMPESRIAPMSGGIAAPIAAAA